MDSYCDFIFFVHKCHYAFRFQLNKCIFAPQIIGVLRYFYSRVLYFKQLHKDYD